MRQINDKYFLDTNIIIYAHTDINSKKQTAAHKIANLSNVFISTQVINECSFVFNKKFNYSWNDVFILFNELKKNFTTHTVSIFTIEKAFNIADRYKFSFYDSLIISAALECDCKILYSEDLQHKQVIEKSLTIINPFA